MTRHKFMRGPGDFYKVYLGHLVPLRIFPPPGGKRKRVSYLLIPRIEIVARAGRSGHVVVGTWAVRPAAPARETVTAAIAFETAGRAVHLRLRPGDEGGQAIDAAGIGNHRLRLGLGLRLILRLRAMLALAMMFAR